VSTLAADAATPLDPTNSRSLLRAHTGRRRSRAGTGIRYLLVALALVFFLFPIVWIASVSVKLPADYLRNPPVWIPTEITFLHYKNVMAEKGTLALTNSIIIAGCATLI
jgi:multiple sugar transport system permease protein